MSHSTDVSRLRSFIDVAPDSPFPIQNLPYGIFRSGPEASPRAGVALGEWIVDLGVLELKGLFREQISPDMPVFNQPVLNSFLAMGHQTWTAVRRRLQDLLSVDNPILRDDEPLRKQAFHRMTHAEMLLPVQVGDYTDFYSSKHHAFNVGTLFRGTENALLPNYLELPVAYHGRSSSLIVSGTDVHRPRGQVKDDKFERPVFSPSQLLDFELEIGCFTGPGNALGHPIPIDEAENHIFGFVLVNDWSARDIQRWEYQPLGPFNSKNFATSISPWIVTLDALRPFRIYGPSQEPHPLDYLKAQDHWGLDIPIDVLLQTKTMSRPEIISRSNTKHLYWTPSQQLAHHTVTGCNLRPGDLLASGTISGPEKNSRGSMLELSWRGSEPVQLSNGETRTFLEDGDRVVLRAECQSEDFRVGFGEVSARILPPLD